MKTFLKMARAKKDDDEKGPAPPAATAAPAVPAAPAGAGAAPAPAPAVQLGGAAAVAAAVGAGAALTPPGKGPPAAGGADGEGGAAAKHGRAVEPGATRADVGRPAGARWEAWAPQLEVVPITMYNSDYALARPRHARAIAVSREYMCYGLKGGQVRVINKLSASRALLRGHSEPLSDMAFFGPASDLLATAAEDGQVFVRRIREEGEELVDETVLHVTAAGEAAAAPVKLAWHRRPGGAADALAFCVNGRVFLPSLARSAGQTVLEVDVTSPPPNVPCLEAGAPVTGLAFSPCGAMLAVATAAGDLSVWEIDPVRLEPHELRKAYSSHKEAPLSAVEWLDSATLVTGTSANAGVQLWTLTDTGLVGRQNLGLHDSEREMFNQLEVDRASQLVLLANSKPSAVGDTNTLYCLHYALGAAGAGPAFDYVAAFTTAMPVLSMSNLQEEPEKLSMYCIQSQAIQKYLLKPSTCWPDGFVPAPPAPEPAPALEPEPAVSLPEVSLRPSSQLPAPSLGGAAPAAAEAAPAPAEEDEEDEEEEEPGDGLSLMAHIQGRLPAVQVPAPPAPMSPAEILDLAKAAPQDSTTAKKKRKEKKKKAPPPLAPAGEPAVDILGLLAKGAQKKEAPPAPLAAPPPLPAAPVLPPPPALPVPAAVPPGTASVEGLSMQLVAMQRDFAMQMQANQARTEKLLLGMGDANVGQRVAAMEAGLHAKLDGIKAYFEKKRGDERKQFENVLRAVSATLNKELPLNLEKIIQREIGGIARTIADSVVPAFEASLAEGPGLQRPLEKALAAQLAPALQAPLTAGLKANFQATVLPAFEAATRVMFAQIQTSFDQGMDQHRQALGAHAEGLKGAAADLRAAASAAAAGAAAAPVGDTPPGDAPAVKKSLSMEEVEELLARQDPRAKLKRLVQEGKLEKAFTEVLTSQDMDQVMWLAEHVALPQLIAAKPCPLSQGVLLALLHLLTADLAAWDPRAPFGPGRKAKVEALQAAAMALDGSGGSKMKGATKQILAKLLAAIDLLVPELEGDGLMALSVARQLINFQSGSL